MTSSTHTNPTTLRTSARIPLCFYCDAALIAKSGLHWCGKCGVWFLVRPVEVVPVTVMI